MNLLIDGSSLLWRSYYTSDRDVDGVTKKFLSQVQLYASMYNSQDIYIAWDKKILRGKNFRQLSGEGEYKAQRDKSVAENVYVSQPIIHKISHALGCRNLYPWTMEADDIISWLSTTLGGSSVVITTDGDMLQLINTTTCVYNPQKKLTIDHNNFDTIMEMPIEHFLAYKAILGDKSDNIEGITGFGPVNSKILAKKWVEKTEPINEEMTAIIERNLQLMDLSIGYILAGEKELEAYNLQIAQYKDVKFDEVKFNALCKEYKYYDMIEDLTLWKRAFEKSPLLQILDELTF
jgi:DNA polymerase I|tara:strand:- start:491 stop:1363 length:873 start_codon:yes stop_codon:yes gene_type:complete